MPDMLVKLYGLPQLFLYCEGLERDGIEIRRALVPEKSIIVKWVRESFFSAWADECEMTFSNKPVSCHIALRQRELVGFACYDAVCRNFFGPSGVATTCRRSGIGKGLLLSCLHSMKEKGYAYAIIGGVGPAEFYQKSVGAVLIEGSDPGIYGGMLK
ncbi:MAG: GNAT family N-acetyltransferase [Pseudomonadota bacterium]